MSSALLRIRSSTLHQRLDTRDLPSELSALAASFNEMLDRLQEAFDRLSRFSSDIAHELRTPIGHVRGEVEVARRRLRTPEHRETLGSCLEGCDRLSTLGPPTMASDPRKSLTGFRMPSDLGIFG